MLWFSFHASCHYLTAQNQHFKLRLFAIITPAVTHTEIHLAGYTSLAQFVLEKERALIRHLLQNVWTLRVCISGQLS